jgi:hypothetical protein
MNVALWAEIRRLSEIEQLSARAIAQRLHCARRTVVAALALSQPPTKGGSPRSRLVDPYVDQIQALLARYPELSAVRIHEEISRGPNGYRGSVIVLRRYLRTIRPTPGSVPVVPLHQCSTTPAQETGLRPAVEIHRERFDPRDRCATRSRGSLADETIACSNERHCAPVAADVRSTADDP